MFFGEIQSESDIIKQFNISEETMNKFIVLSSLAYMFNTKHQYVRIKAKGEILMYLLSKDEGKTYELSANYLEGQKLDLTGQWEPYEISREKMLHGFQEEYRLTVLDKIKSAGHVHEQDAQMN